MDKQAITMLAERGSPMSVYQRFLFHLIRDYTLGSSLAVIGVGSVFIFTTLKVNVQEMMIMSQTLILSLLVMFVVEFIVFHRHLRPIRTVFRQNEPSYEDIQKAFLQAHRFPVLAVRRIFGPHLLGLSVPAVLLTAWHIYSGGLNIPYYYLGFGAVGAVLVASMHALIEFFLTNHTIRPILLKLSSMAATLHHKKVTLNGRVIVKIQSKFQLSAFLIGTFPLFLFSLATQIRLLNPSTAIQDPLSYWQWAGMILLMGIGFSSLGAWLLARDVRMPIQHLYESMGIVQEGKLDQEASDIYSDEFSRLIAGFNHMLEGLRVRDRMNNQLIDSYFATLAAALDARDPYTAGHSQRVAAYSVKIGQLAGLSVSEMDLLNKSALLHDIGKIGVRDAVLLKEGKLTEEEFGQIKLHPVLGESILKQIEPAHAMAPLLPGVRSHHENYNGRGYPDGLVGEQIPLQGRIIAVADAFDAMTSDRPYRKGMSVERALSILEEGKGTQWDPALVDLFLSTFDKS
jgi:hypothetical protein